MCSHPRVILQGLLKITTRKGLDGQTRLYNINHARSLRHTQDSKSEGHPGGVPPPGIMSPPGQGIQRGYAGAVSTGTGALVDRVSFRFACIGCMNPPVGVTGRLCHRPVNSHCSFQLIARRLPCHTWAGRPGDGYWKSYGLSAESQAAGG